MNAEYALTILASISPELVVTATALVILVADLFLDEKWRKQLGYGALLGLAVAFAIDRFYILPESNLLNQPPLLFLCPFTVFFKDVILAATALTIVLYQQQKGLSDFYPGEFIGLLLFSAAGMMFLVSADDLLMVFLSMEFIGIISYVLVGYIRNDLKAGEGAVKFYLIGAFASAIMVYGMSFIYGLLGTTSISEIGVIMAKAGKATLLVKVSILLLTVGLGFKLAVVPFHSWLPDAMEGGPTPVAAYISVAPKAAGLAVLLRIFGEAFPLSKVQMVGTLTVLAIATMTFGNLMAIPQRNVKRLLAYSSIGHIGYILIGVIASNELGAGGVLVYVLAYVFMNLGAFACVIAVSNRLGSDDIEDYAGLSQRSLPIALLLVLFLLSLGGLPPTAGFLGKWLVFGSAVDAARALPNPWASPYLFLVIAGILNSVVSIYYYFRLAHQMFFREPRERTGIEGSGVLWLGMGFAAVMILLLGIFPGQMIDAAQSAVKLLHLWKS